MKRSVSLLRGAAVAALLLVSVGFAAADQLADIKKAGVLKVAVIDQNPPFGQIDEATKETVGYDVDFAKLLAAKIGVKLEIVGTNPANRIPFLQSGKVDLIVADLTNTAERAKVISYDDLPLGIAALRAGTVDAFTQDGSVLVPALANAPDKAKFKILPDFVSKELIGIGVKKGEKAAEKDGTAAKIYDQWFGTKAQVPAPRNFVIEAGK